MCGLPSAVRSNHGKGALPLARCCQLSLISEANVALAGIVLPTDSAGMYY